MQVSWIDANEVRDLLALLAEPAPRSDAGFPDLESLPDAADRYGFPMLAEKPKAAIASLHAPLPPPPPPVAVASPPPPRADVEAAIQPDVNLIRERLRAIRDRAQQAGLLPKETPAERAARAAATNPPAPPIAPAPSIASAPPAPPPPHAPPAPPVPQQAPAAVHQYAAQTATSTAPTRTVLERLDEFARWCANVTSSEEMFMLDDLGDLLWGSPTSGDYLICAKLAMTAGMRPHGALQALPSSTTTVQVGLGKELQLLSCPASHGNVTIALVNPKKVPISALREGFSLAVGG